MLLANMADDPLGAYLHLERYVNVGSPSGFTEQYTTSDHTKASGTAGSFYLCSVEFPDAVNQTDYGQSPEFFTRWAMLAHPDMIDDGLFGSANKIDRSALEVVPTSSSRTVKALDNSGWFLKLCYKGRIGRIERQLTRAHASSAVTVSSRISAAIDSGTMPRSFFFMREPFARVIDLPTGDSTLEWGIVLREPDPYPKNQEIKYLIPAFSMFSPDPANPNDPSILDQILQAYTASREEILFEDILRPIFDSYFSLLLKQGLGLECHAQNTLFALDSAFRVIGVVAKDAESIDKDLSLMNDLGLPMMDKEPSYKCLVRGQYNYHIMHSFMFDFKLGEYLITPLIQEAAKASLSVVSNLQSRIREYNQRYINQLPPDYFPIDGKWYSYAPIIHDPNLPRPYIANEAPIYR